MLKDMFTLSGRWGRLNRLRFFLYGLSAALIAMIAMVTFALLGFGAAGSGLGGAVWLIGILVAIPVYIGLLWVQICLTVKRLHDLNHSGWWMLAVFGFSLVSGFADTAEMLGLVLNIPIIIYGLYLLFWPGTAGDNQYGPDPKEVS